MSDDDRKSTPVQGAGPTIEAQLVVQFFIGGGISFHCTDPDPVRALGYLEVAKAQVLSQMLEPPEEPQRKRIETVRVI